MNRLNKYKVITIPIALLVVVFIILLITGWFNPVIKFESGMTDSDFTLYNTTRTVNITFKTPFKQKLKPDVYYVRANNTQKYSQLEQKITIKESGTIDLFFNFNENIFDQDRLHIKSLLLKKYPSTISDNFYTILPGKFFKNGTFYATSIGFMLKDDYGKSQLFGNIYNIIFQKVDGSWKQLTHPELIISSLKYKNIPIEIIQEVNFWHG